MRAVPTAVSVTLIVMGSLLLAVPAIYEMVMAGQESYVLAHSPARSFPSRALSGPSQLSFFVVGLAMIVFGVKTAMARPDRPRSD